MENFNSFGKEKRGKFKQPKVERNWDMDSGKYDDLDVEVAGKVLKSTDVDINNPRKRIEEIEFNRELKNLDKEVWD